MAKEGTNSSPTLEENFVPKKDFKGRKYQIYGEMILMLIERDMQFDVTIPNIYDCTLEQH